MHDMANFLPETNSSGDDIRTFFDLATSLSLSEAEQAALLDLSVDEVEQLSAGNAPMIEQGGSKLQRRLAYAIPILRKMLASIAS